MLPAIVVMAHNRPKSLQRILSSLAAARVPLRTPLIISIDHSDAAEPTRAVAENFSWRHGDKQVLFQPTTLGLRQHLLYCGEFSQHYNGIVVLEDDLYVSPEFYDYARNAAV